MQSIKYIDINERIVSNKIETLFPLWSESSERICILSPHDDDAIIGAGYVISAAVKRNIEVFIIMFTNGDLGYSNVSQKNNIVEIRKFETLKAYRRIGVKEENIIRFNYNDLSLFRLIGWMPKDNIKGCFKDIITILRKTKITRLLIPNHYRENLDHHALSFMGLYDMPYVGDPTFVDWGDPFKISSILEYSVWSDLDPEDALTNNRKTNLRANKIVVVSEDIEKEICAGISDFKSQGDIIRGLVESRKERIDSNGNYIEVYLAFDPRPKLDFRPYINFITDIEGNSNKIKNK